MSSLTTTLAAALNWTLAVGGLAAAWRLRGTIATLNQKATMALPPWDIRLSDFLFFILLVTLGGIGGGLLVGLVVRYHPLDQDHQVVLATLFGQVGILAGVALFRLVHERHRTPVPTVAARKILFSGVVTFVIAMPLIMFFMVLSQALLTYLHVPLETQESVRLFINAKTPFMVSGMILTACVGAPMMEEYVFRAGIFRYVRTRLSRGAALLGPAIFFAALHVNWLTLEGLASFLPLIVLAVIFSLAYEHTGQVGTVVVAHALFNFYTVVLIFCGVGVS